MIDKMFKFTRESYVQKSNIERLEILQKAVCNYAEQIATLRGKPGFDGKLFCCKVLIYSTKEHPVSSI